MLLSPGHSPRHLSSPSPSSSISEKVSDNPSSSTPVNPRKRPAVLDEDTYVASIEKIIERDFFPDISKLRDRLDWLEAIRTRDPIQIRDAQLKIMERRGKRLNPSHTDSRTQTPGSTFTRNFTPLDDDFIKTPHTPSSVAVEGLYGDSTAGEGSVDDSVSLDAFFRRYTSEDNDSFSKILEKVNKKRKEKYAYLTAGENEDVKLIEGAKRESITDGFGTSDQPVSTLEGWNYTAKNLLMYHPADLGEAPLTEDEKEVRIKGLTKAINRVNTRFHGKVAETDPSEDGALEVLYTPIAGATPMPFSRDGDRFKKYDLDDLRKTPNPFYVESQKADNGYSFVKTPSPAPGADGSSPFITWGEIEGTPLRLETEDTPIDIGGSSSDGPNFKIPLPPVRDVKAHSLSRDAARNLRQRSRMFQKPPLPSPGRGGSASPVRTLSPAAQKFMRNTISKTSSTIDESLRASYRGGSPSHGTPKGGRSASRFARDGSVDSKSPSVREGSNPAW